MTARRSIATNSSEPAPAAGKSRNEWRTVSMVLPYLWEYRGRVLLALIFLVTAKIANVGVPLVMKEIVDALDPRQAVLVLPLMLLAAYGVLRLSNTLFAELRDIVFVRVAQHAIRRIALTVFRHLHSLSLRFHLDRQTGGMTRDIERGTRGIGTLMNYMLFSIIPVILEFGLVAAAFCRHHVCGGGGLYRLYVFSIRVAYFAQTAGQRTRFACDHAGDRQSAQL